MNSDLQTQVLRERVSKLEALVRFLYKHLDVTYVQGDFELDPADKEVAEWLKQHNELKAMAAYRSIHNVSLAEAKTAVDEIRMGLGY
jgi:ribosomal protein L7/L12